MLCTWQIEGGLGFIEISDNDSGWSIAGRISFRPPIRPRAGPLRVVPAALGFENQLRSECAEPKSTRSNCIRTDGSALSARSKPRHVTSQFIVRRLTTSTESLKCGRSDDPALEFFAWDLTCYLRSHPSRRRSDCRWRGAGRIRLNLDRLADAMAHEP
jgi:hypothetical protein